MQGSWSKMDVVMHQEDLAKLALACLHRATQLMPSAACTSVKQECEVYSRLHTATGSAAHMKKLQECLVVYRSGC